MTDQEKIDELNGVIVILSNSIEMLFNLVKVKEEAIELYQALSVAQDEKIEILQKAIDKLFKIGKQL